MLRFTAPNSLSPRKQAQTENQYRQNDTRHMYKAKCEKGSVRNPIQVRVTRLDFVRRHRHTTSLPLPQKEKKVMQCGTNCCWAPAAKRHWTPMQQRSLFGKATVAKTPP
jgi:hypothetical protein